MRWYDFHFPSYMLGGILGLGLMWLSCHGYL